MSDGTTEPYSLGSINVDTAKELFAFLGQVYPFSDEISKDAYGAKVASLDSAGNPNEGVENPLPAPALPPTDSTPTEPPADSTEAETPAEDTTEVTEEAPAAPTTPQDSTANAPEAPTSAATPAPEISDADATIAALEQQLADAKAAKEQQGS